MISGFVSASGGIIAASQLKHLLGIKAEGESLLHLLVSLWEGLPKTNWITLAIGGSALLFLFWVRKNLKPLLRSWGLGPRLADMLTKAGPVAAIAVTTWLVWLLELNKSGVKIVGTVPPGLPPFIVPSWDPVLWKSLLGPALLLSLVGFVESVSVGQTLAAKRRQRIEPDQELVALGASNLASAFSGGFPVTGGFSRSVVNFDAGAQTPAAGVYTAVGLALASLLLTPALYYLPQATLAATIIVAVLSLVDLGMLKRTWTYSKSDFSAVAATLGVTFVAGVEAGLVAGLAISLLLFLYKTSRPHIAEVGLVPGTQHFRNVLRHEVLTDTTVLSLRVDESLYFANARFLEDRVGALVAERSGLQHVVLLCSAVNEIDASALESLEALEHRLKDAGITLHLSEVKGPVMDRLKTTHFLHELRGEVYLTHFDAVRALTPAVASAATPATA